MTYTIVYILIAAFVLIIFSWLRLRRARRQEGQHYPEGKQLYVGNLAYNANHHHVRELFADYGMLEDIRVIKNSRTGRSKGFAFVTFVDQESAKAALALNGADFRGRALVVRMAKPRE